ncbi:hypothetical protein [Flexithrix dorotheae]|uniref:hypothetical protein n=1 Tax=Flexithrix dorotheae TaxID=70993 RepID=UPI0012F97EB2|nr:hypothetical protein [Flexithrix dorotheae]
MIRLRIILFFFIPAMFCGLSAKGQKRGDKIVSFDTISIKANNFLFYEDSIFDIPKDTVVIIPSNKEYVIQDKTKTTRFYEKLKLLAYKRKTTKELYDVLINFSAYINPLDTTDFIRSEEKFREFEGKTISSIRIKHVEILDGSVYDTTATHRNRLTELLDDGHFYTREHVLFDYLIVKEGETVNPYLLADNERIIRDLSFIEDVRILPVIQENNPEEVELVIIVKDVFSIGLGGSGSSPTDFRIDLYDRNFLGMGIEFNNSFFYKANENPTFAYRGRLTNPNLAGTLITGTFEYIRDFEYSKTGIDFQREFLYPNLKYGGGLAVNQVEDFRIESEPSDSIIRVPFKTNVYDVWLGRSFKVSNSDERKRLIVANRVYKTDFLARPEVSQDSNFFFHDRSGYIGSISYSRRDYLNTRMLLGFNRTENVPVGFKAGVTFGYDYGEFLKRPYGGLEITYGIKIDPFGYFSASNKIGSFYRNNGFEDLTFLIQGGMFSNLKNLGIWKVRHFVDFQFALSKNRLTKIQNLNLSENLNGYSGLKPDGDRKLILNYESVFFTPIYFYGFRVALFNFVDVGLIGFDSKSLFEGLYSSFGIGARIRNEGLVFQTIQLKLGYVPKTFSGNGKFFYDFSFSDPKLFGNNVSDKPALIEVK